jgi:hypothetical protein
MTEFDHYCDEAREGCGRSENKKRDRAFINDRRPFADTGYRCPSHDPICQHQIKHNPRIPAS